LANHSISRIKKPFDIMDKLTEIMAWKRTELASRIRPVSSGALSSLGSKMGDENSFRDALANPEELSVIAEIKRKSPSAGSIAEDISAVEQARSYLNADADALSVLTDKKYFGGELEDLWEVNDFIRSHQRTIPTLRKDFMIHPIQVMEALEAGARAILLIVRALDDNELKALREAADLANLDCLYEIHEEKELEKALAHDPEIIGVNNRDLSRFVTDLETTERLFPLIPHGITKVSESGILEPEDAWRVRAAGADAVLCGEALMRSSDPEGFVHEMKERE
jgi:indole-3-glycerol phosphate synthase